MAIENAAAHRVACEQPDPVLISSSAILLAMQELQPAQAQDHCGSEQDHEGQQRRRLLLHACLPLSA